MEANKKYMGKLIPLIIFLFLSVFLNVFQWKTNDSVITEYNKNIDSLITVRVDIEKELASTTEELSRYKGISEKLDMLVNEANRKVTEQEKRISTMLKEQKNSNSLNQKLKEELAELKKLRDDYLDQIDILLTENSELKKQNNQLNYTIADLSDNKNKLEQKVNEASKLKTEYVVSTSLRKKNNNKYTTTSMAKKTDKLKVCFSILENKVAPAGEKIVYLRIVAPNGLPMGDRSKGSKGFISKDTREEVFYTASQKINYTNSKQDVCLEYEESERIFSVGTYTIEIYIDGYLSTTGLYLLR